MKPKKVKLNKWQILRPYVIVPCDVYIDKLISINKYIYLAKKSNKFRLKSQMDWAWYTPRTLAHAINTGTVDSYYQVMLGHQNSDPNVWPDLDFEMELKSYYAARVGRCSQLP